MQKPLLLAVTLWLAAAGPAAACGGLFCARIPVDQTGEKILFAADGKTITAHVQIQYKGDAKSFSWIVPVPTPPKLGVGSDMLFAQLRQTTQPRFTISVRDEGPCQPPVLRPMRAESGIMRKGGAPMGGRAPSVTVVSQEQVGPYDTAVLQANDAGVLKAWLRKNSYVIPPKLDPLLDPYVAGKYSFVALKLTKNSAVGDIQPIVMTYKATKPGIPIRLTGVAATPDMNIWVWVLGNRRAVPENFRHARINEAKIDWMSGGDNYKDVVTRAVDEAGGQAFVTDYAGPADVVGSDQFTRGHFKLDSLARTTDPVLFAEAVTDTGFFGQRYGALNQEALVAFLKKYIRKPRSLAKLGDMDFYRFIESHGEALHEAGIKVDAPRAVAELEKKVVKPSEEIARLFERFHTLSAMYTTMSPAEMTQDPTFVFNGKLPEVKVERHAEGVRRCKPGLPYFETPIEVTLANGQHFTMPANGPRYPRPRRGISALPDAEVIEQLKAAGPPSVIQDNTAAIKAALAEPPQAAPTGNAMGLAGLAAAGLLVLGGLGLRRARR